MNPSNFIRRSCWPVCILTCWSILIAVSPSVLAQSEFVVTPNQVNLSAAAGYAEIQLEFTGDPFPWSLSFDANWLTIDPMTGVGAASLVIEYNANEYLRRRAELIFTATDGSGTELSVEVCQMQGSAVETLLTWWEYLEQEPDIQEMMPYTGQFNFNYTPWETGVWLNVVAKSDRTEEPVWIIPNIYLPDKSWTDKLQQLSICFNLEELGYQVGEPVGNLQFGYTLSTFPDRSIPGLGNELIMNAIPVSYSKPSFGGYSSPLIFNGFPLTNFFPKTGLEFPFIPDDYYHIGCEMTNGNLEWDKYYRDMNSCGPAAAANSLLWLKSKHKLEDLPASWRTLLEYLQVCMNHSVADGVSYQDFISGKLNVIEMFDLKISVKYKGEDLPDSIPSFTGHSKARKIKNDTYPTSYPTPEWIANELKEGEDVEIGFKKNGKRFGHAVVVTGFYRYGDHYFFVYKDDQDQKTDDQSKLRQSHSYVYQDSVSKKYVIANEGNAVIEWAVSESYDSTHIQVPKTLTFTEFCQSVWYILPPRAAVRFTFPGEGNYSGKANTRIHRLSKGAWIVLGRIKDSPFVDEQTVKNPYDEIVLLEVHNEVYTRGKTNPPWILNVRIDPNDTISVTSPEVFDEFAGFSVGSNDDSSGEFGDLTIPEVTYQDSLGASQGDFPQRMAPGGVRKLILHKEVITRSNYWNSMALVIGIQSVQTPGTLLVNCPITGYKDTINIIDTEDIHRQIGGMMQAGMFELILEAVDPLAFTFDNLGVPTIVQPDPLLVAEPEILELPRVMDSPATLMVKNLGGEAMTWSTEEFSDWFGVDPTSGVDNTTVDLFFQENTGSERQDTLWVIAPFAENSPQYIVVHQAGVSGILTDPSFPLELRLFPNPAADKISVQLTGLNPGELNIKLIDLSGKEQMATTHHAMGTEYNTILNISSLSSGQYILQVTQGDRQIKKTLQIQ